MPNRLWYFAASELLPQADSSIACAMVTAAGTPHRRWAATDPGAIRLMNACCARVPGVACAAGAYCRECSGRAAADGGGAAADRVGAAADGVAVAADGETVADGVAGADAVADGE